MPFASIINSEDPEYTDNNYKQCLNKSNFKLGIKISKPFDGIFNIFKMMFSGLANTAVMIVRYIVYFLMLILEIFKSILNRVLKIFDELNFILVRLSDMVNHILAIFTYIYYMCIKVIDLVKFILVLVEITYTVLILVPIGLNFTILTLLFIRAAYLAYIMHINPFTAPLSWPFWIKLAFQAIRLIISGTILTVTIILGVILGQGISNLYRTMSKSGFKNLNDIDYEFEDEKYIVKQKIKYIMKNTEEKILAGNFKDINLSFDNLIYKDNKILPKCCQYNPHYSSDKGCICSTLEQEEYLKRNGLNKSYNNNNDCLLYTSDAADE